MSECTSSDSDNVLILETTNPNLRVSACNAATQTPELPRRVMATSSSATKEYNHSPSIVLMTVTGDSKILNLKEDKAMDIPDVVVEYIKDNCGNGNTNPAFQNDEVLIRTASRASFREDSKSDASSLNLQHPEMNNRSLGSEDGLLPIGTQNPRLYYSMPRRQKKDLSVQQDIQLHSQPSTPKLQRLNISHQQDVSASLLSLLQQSGGNIVVPPSPNFGYRPLESETSAVYTIIKTCVDTNALKEIHFLPALSDSVESSPILKRKFEYTPPPPNIEKIRRRLQLFTDFWSTLFLVISVLMAVFTPVLIIPMFMYPIEYFIEYISYFVVSGTISVIILALSCFLGNVVWHYNENTKKLRPRLHCGRGPSLHFWASSFYYAADDAKAKKENEKEIIV